MSKIKYNDYVEVIGGFNQGLKGRVFARVFWIYYLIKDDHYHNFDCFWFNIKKITQKETSK